MLTNENQLQLPYKSYITCLTNFTGPYIVPQVINNKNSFESKHLSTFGQHIPE